MKLLRKRLDEPNIKKEFTIVVLDSKNESFIIHVAFITRNFDF